MPCVSSLLVLSTSESVESANDVVRELVEVVFRRGEGARSLGGREDAVMMSSTSCLSNLVIFATESHLLCCFLTLLNPSAFHDRTQHTAASIRTDIRARRGSSISAAWLNARLQLASVAGIVRMLSTSYKSCRYLVLFYS